MVADKMDSAIFMGFAQYSKWTEQNRSTGSEKERKLYHDQNKNKNEKKNDSV